MSGVCGCIEILVLSVCLLVPPSTAGAELVDRIVAAVNNDVITASELALAVALNTRLGSAETDRKALESETLDGLVTRRLLIQEARRLKFAELSDQDLSAEMEKLSKRLGSGKALDDFLKGLDVTLQEITRMLGERLTVSRFVEKKVGLFVRVSRDEAQNYFESHSVNFHGRHFKDVQKSIVTLLTERKTEQQLDRYVAELRGKAIIRINSSEEKERRTPADRLSEPRQTNSQS